MRNETGRGRAPFEARVRERMGEAQWFDSEDELTGARMDYFGPVARRARGPRPAAKRCLVGSRSLHGRQALARLPT